MPPKAIGQSVECLQVKAEKYSRLLLLNGGYATVQSDSYNRMLDQTPRVCEGHRIRSVWVAKRQGGRGEVEIDTRIGSSTTNDSGDYVAAAKSAQRAGRECSRETKRLGGSLRWIKRRTLVI
jgi:hypothetical protein